MGPLGIFQADDGDRLRESRMGQILGMRATSANVIGEWDPDPSRGSALDSLRNASNSLAVEDFAKVYVRNAFAQALPDERLMDVQAMSDGTTLSITVTSVPTADRGTSRARTVEQGIKL